MERPVDQLRLIAGFADALPAAIWVGRAPSGECVYVNAAFERVLGLRPPDEASRGNYVGPYGVHTLTGEPYPEDRMPYELVLRQRAAVVVDDIVIHRHDGEKTYLRVFASPIFDGAGQIEYVVEAFIDITREVEAQRDRLRGERELQHTRRMEAIGSLAGGIAHDFNNLLSIVKLVAASLRHTDRGPARQDLLQNLNDVADSAAQLTRALLGFAGRAGHRAERVAANPLIRGLVELASRTFESRLTVATDLQASVDQIIGDGSQLEQVLMNLLLNARDAVAGGGRVTVRTRDVVIAADAAVALPAGRYLAIDVEDSGPGIDPAVRDRIFEPYVTTKGLGPHKGTGLGLATAYGIVQAHRGRLDILATGPSGTTMRVLLPAVLGGAPGVAGRRPEPPLIRGTGTILIIEDEPLVLKTCAATLRDLGYDVELAGTGHEAVGVLRDRAEQLSAVLLDLSLPDMTAREICTAIRELRDDLPVILTTGFAIDESAQEIVALGVRAYHPKPLDAAHLSQTLARVLRTAGR